MTQYTKPRKSYARTEPNATIHLAWIPGIANSTDLVSKIIVDPIEAVNSSLFRKGGDVMRTSKYKGEIYMTIDKDGVRWLGLSNDVTKLE